MKIDPAAELRPWIVSLSPSSHPIRPVCSLTLEPPAASGPQFTNGNSQLPVQPFSCPPFCLRRSLSVLQIPPPPAGKRPGLRRRCNCHARLGHRRQYCDFLARAIGAAQSASFPRTRPPARRVGGRSPF